MPSVTLTVGPTCLKRIFRGGGTKAFALGPLGPRPRTGVGAENCPCAQVSDPPARADSCPDFGVASGRRTNIGLD